MCVSRLCVSKLLVIKLCVNRFCVYKFCVNKLFVRKLYVSGERTCCVRVLSGTGGGRRQAGMHNQIVL